MVKIEHPDGWELSFTHDADLMHATFTDCGATIDRTWNLTRDEYEAIRATPPGQHPPSPPDRPPDSFTTHYA
jgi:hypothetical protein